MSAASGMQDHEVHYCIYQFTYSFRRSMGKNIDSVQFQHFSPYFIIFMANLPFEKCWYVHFLRGEGGVRKYVLYTHLNVDNYGRPLSGISNKTLKVSTGSCNVTLHSLFSFLVFWYFHLFWALFFVGSFIMLFLHMLVTLSFVNCALII